MPDPQMDGERKTTRRMKSHKKSRAGCGNCKIRKVKCDENKPMCKRCQMYGTFCNYDPQYADLQPLEHRTGGILALQPSISLENAPILGMLDPTTDQEQKFSPALFTTNYQFSTRDFELLQQFETKTLFTLGTGRNEDIYRAAFKRLARSHTFLFHVVLTVTLMHNQYLGIGVGAEQSAAMAFHWSQGAALMNQRLSSHIESSECDALWACAGMFGLLAFTSFETKTVEETWPLKDSPTDLEWLKLCEGKKEIWKIANPLREDSLFHSLVPNFLGKPSSTSDSRLLKLPLELIELCRLKEPTRKDINPHLAPACCLAQVIDVECDGKNLALFLSFFGQMQNDYKILLKNKDPCALLILAYWYAKMSRYRQWWVWPRAVLECQAICKFLRLYYGEDNNILKALPFPETICAAQVALGMPK